MWLAQNWRGNRLVKFIFGVTKTGNTVAVRLFYSFGGYLILCSLYFARILQNYLVENAVLADERNSLGFRSTQSVFLNKNVT